MPRQPLRGISGNSNYKGGITGRFELTPYWRTNICGHAAGGQAPQTIIDNLNMSFSIIMNILSQANSCYENESQH